MTSVRRATVNRQTAKTRSILRLVIRFSKNSLIAALFRLTVVKSHKIRYISEKFRRKVYCYTVGNCIPINLQKKNKNKYPSLLRHTKHIYVEMHQF